MKSAPAIAFDYAPSRIVALAAGIVAAIALVALALSGLPLVIKMVAGIAASAYAASSVRRFLHAPARRLAWHAAGNWRMAGAGGVEQNAELEHAIARGGWIVLRLRGADRQRNVFILGPDNSDAELRRRVRVRLARTDAQPSA